MTLQTNLADTFLRIATESKALRTMINGNAVGLSALNTSAKTSLVAAINELDAALDALSGTAAGINDAAVSSSSTWSSTKTTAEIAALLNDALGSSTGKTWSIDKINTAIAAAALQLKNDLTNGAGAAMDTLKELSDALGGDGAFAANMAASLSHRVRVDATQAFTTAQKLQGCQNLGIGDPETNFVAVFNAGLV